MWTYLYQLFIKLVYVPFFSLLAFLEKDLNWYITFIVLFIVLTNIEDKLVHKIAAQTEKSKKMVILQKTAKFFSILILVTVLIVTYNRFLKPTVTEIMNYKSPTPSPTNSTTNPSTDTTPNTQATPGKTTPTYQAPKRLYYSLGCSSCWNQSCPRNGYSYGGYDYGYYYYYYNLCKACNCNDFRAQSLWR